MESLKGSFSFCATPVYIRNMQQQVSIRKATINDVAELERLVNSAYRGESSKTGWTTEADLLGGIRITKEGLIALLHNEAATLLIAEDANGNIAGCVDLELQGDALYLGMLTVAPQLQNAGIGKKLLYAAEDWARTHNRHKISMTVITLRHTLIAWYERHGYKLTGQTLPFPDDPAFGLPKQHLEFMVLEKMI